MLHLTAGRKVVTGVAFSLPFASLGFTLFEWRKGLQRDNADRWQNVGVSKARSFFNERFISNYIDIYGGLQGAENP